MKEWKTRSGYTICKVLSGRSNVFLVTCGERNILVDTSPGRKWNELQKRLTLLGIRHLDYLVLTHSHFDHAANASRVRKKYGARAIIHQSEEAYLSSGNNIVPQGTNIFTQSLMKVAVPVFVKRFRYEACKPDIFLDDLSFNFIDIQNVYILPTPGHTPGSVSLIVDNEIAIVGDTMFGVFKNSAFPPFANDVPGMINSWKKLLDTPCCLFLPSHGNAVTRELLKMDYEKLINKLS